MFLIGLKVAYDTVYLVTQVGSEMIVLLTTSATALGLSLCQLVSVVKLVNQVNMSTTISQGKNWFKKEIRNIILMTVTITISLLLRAIIDLFLVYLSENRTILLLVAESLVVVIDIFPIALRTWIFRESMKPSDHKERSASDNAFSVSDNMTELNLTDTGYS